MMGKEESVFVVELNWEYCMGAGSFWVQGTNFEDSEQLDKLWIMYL